MSKPRNVVKERTPCQQTTCLACKFHVRPTCSSCPTVTIHINILLSMRVVATPYLAGFNGFWSIIIIIPGLEIDHY